MKHALSKKTCYVNTLFPILHIIMHPRFVIFTYNLSTLLYNNKKLNWTKPILSSTQGSRTTLKNPMFKKWVNRYHRDNNLSTWTQIVTRILWQNNYHINLISHYTECTLAFNREFWNCRVDFELHKMSNSSWQEFKKIWWWLMTCQKIYQFKII